MNAYIYKVTLQEEEDGRWSVWIPSLPVCTSWGYSREEALKNIQEAAQCHIEAMLEDGDPVPVENIGGINIIPSAAVVANIDRQIA